MSCQAEGHVKLSAQVHCSCTLLSAPHTSWAVPAGRARRLSTTAASHGLNARAAGGAGGGPLARMLGLAQVEGGRVVLAPLLLRHPLLGGAALQQLVSRHYTRAALPQLFKLAASADVLGAPPRPLPGHMASKHGSTPGPHAAGAAFKSGPVSDLHPLRYTCASSAVPAAAQATRGGCCTTWAWACGPSWRSRRRGCCAPPAAGGSAACPRSVAHDDDLGMQHMVYHMVITCGHEHDSCSQLTAVLLVERAPAL